MEVREFIDTYKDEMIQDLAKLVAYNSVYSDDEPPFGKANREVLAEALTLMEEKGLRTKNLDNYCAYGELGQGAKVIGILAHLDIVPAGEGWKSDPFKLEIRDDVLYGRGVSDDKGAAIASLYALKYLHDTNYQFKNRVRLILGANEESGSKCIEYYVNKEGSVDLGFTPDANFPGIFAEKGIIGGEVRALSSRIIDIKGGEASNVVMKKVTVRLLKDSYDESLLNEFFRDHDIEYNIIKEDNFITLNVFGKAAHSSTPDLGINAFNYLMEGLYIAGFDDELVAFFHDKIGLDNHGHKIGLERFNDQYCDSTLNIGVVHKVEGKVSFSIDVRFPPTAKTEEVKAYLEEKLNLGNNHFLFRSSAEPLFFDPESKLPKALREAYIKVTGDDKTKMMAIGGGTYAKAMNNCIAFGCEFLGHDGHIHDVDECLSVEDLLKQVAIYIEAIKNLDEVL